MKTISILFISTLIVFICGCESDYEICHRPSAPDEVWHFIDTKDNSIIINEDIHKLIAGNGSEIFWGRYSIFIIEPRTDIDTAIIINDSGTENKGEIINKDNQTIIKFRLETPDGYQKENYILKLKGEDYEIKIKVIREIIPRHVA